MKIEDVMNTESQPNPNTDEVDLEEVEKTAELLDQLSEKDDTMDQLAKLAVFEAKLRRLEDSNE